MLKIVQCVVLMVFALSTLASAEVYRIDAAAATKEVKPGDYKLGTPTDPAGVAITSNNYYLLKGGKPWLPVMGEIHYARYPDFMWEDAIKKMKAGGIDIVATYCFWIHHEEVQGQFDFTGRRDLHRFIELCKNNGMYVWLRIGPWCHGEVRNGGFPDWLQRMNIQKRRNSPEYLGYVRELFTQYFNQVKGLLYKDGGPIIGIQLENEFGGPPEHILELKRIAREIGFDVPIYSVTGWNNVRIPENEVIPVQAGYPDDFWSRGFTRNPLNEQYLFMAGVPINTGVGTDVLPIVEVYGRRTYNPSDYPWLTAELGLGIEWTQRRRPVIDERDAGALMLIKLAGGANSVGYYMYHGGSNPEGKLSTLQETGGNQCPVISYDFQAAVGEFGEIAPKYRVLKLVHYWLQDFGSELAPMIPSMPDKRPAGVEDI
ncbi:MAG TPA: beta-galactosidase, partial [Tepidisphaeraceae bacterium]|nr:beta-galactosidase [Tepidisphaeraceae bacterium]